MTDFLNGIKIALVKIGISIVSSIYYVAAAAFEIFMALADGTLLDSIDINKLVSNFYVVIGVVMLFVVAFSMLKGMVNPDDAKQGTSVVKKIIINLVTSAVIMAVLPSIFAFAYDFQESFIYRYNPIGKFFGYGGLNDKTSSSIDEIKKGAYQITNGIFTAFFNVNIEECGDGISVEECQGDIYSEKDVSLLDAMTQVDNAESGFYIYPSFAEPVVMDRIDFNILISLLAGLIVCYVAFSFCIDMAIRLVKLVFYQIIAPIPVFLRIIPNGKISGTFGDWMKITLSCYLEVYIRIFTFYFCVYLCNAMLDSPFFTNLNERGFFIGLLSKAFVLVGILIFIKQAPKLLGEITGIKTGNMKLGIMDKLKDAAWAPAALGGGLASGYTKGKNIYNDTRNKWGETRGKTRLGTGAKKAGLLASAVVGGSVSTLLAGGKGALYAGKAGWDKGTLTGVGTEVKKVQNYDEAKKQGMTFKDNASNQVRSLFGFDTTADANIRKIEKGYEIVQNRSSYAIDGIHFGDDGKVYKGKIYGKEENGSLVELNYKDGVYQKNDGTTYDAKNKIYDQKGKALRRFTSGEGLHFDASGEVYKGEIYGTSSNGEKIKLTFEDGVYKDKNDVKYTGQIQGENNMSLSYGFKVNASDIEQVGTLSAQKGAANIAYMEEIRAIDKKKEYGKMQSSIKSGLKDESIKKIDEAGSTYRYNFKYYDKDRDKDGNIIEVEKVFNGTYAEIVEFRNRKLTAEQLIDPRLENIDTIRENMINQVIGSEYAGDKGHKAIIVGGLETLKNYGGYTYLVKDPVTKVVTEKKITVSEKDGKYTMEADGVDIYTSVYESFLKNIEKDASVAEAIAKIEREEPDKDKRDAKIKKIKEESASGMAWFKVFSKLDGLVKESNKILDSERRTIEQTLADENKGQKEASENVSKQFKEQNDAKKKSEEQRKKEAAKKYMANRNGK